MVGKSSSKPMDKWLTRMISQVGLKRKRTSESKGLACVSISSGMLAWRL